MSKRKWYTGGIEDFIPAAKDIVHDKIEPFHKFKVVGSTTVLDYKPTYYMPNITVRIRENSANVDIQGNNYEEGDITSWYIEVKSPGSKLCKVIHISKWNSNRPLCYVSSRTLIKKIYRAKAKYDNRYNKADVLFALNWLLVKLAKERRI